MDRITIQDLEVHYHVGVPDEERARPQRLLVSVEMSTDFQKAARWDDLRETIDYFQVSRRVLAFGSGRSWRLIERLAVELAEMILGEFRPVRVSVEVKKFILPEAAWVAVRVERGR